MMIARGWPSPGSVRFRGLLDRGEGRRNALVRGLGAVGDLRFGAVAVPVVEPGDAGGQELPGLGDLRPGVHRGERVAPPHPPAVDLEGELPAAVRRYDLGSGLPGPLGQFVAPGEPGPGPGSVTVVPPAGLADRA